VEAVVAVTNADNRRTLAALTSAALGLHGLQAAAAVAVANPQLNLQYGHYQESDDRMQVDVYHADFTVPYNDRLELSFSVDRDTYSGATPAFSMPTSMTNQPKYDNGVLTNADIVSAASQGVTAGGLTILGGLNTFVDFRNIYDPGKASIDASINSQKLEENIAKSSAYIAQNPAPPGSAYTLTTQDVTLNFDDMTNASYDGEANIAASGGCGGCYLESGFVMGVVDDGNPTNHIHNNATNPGFSVAYHNDSTGVYLRALDSSAFRILSMSWNTTDPSNARNGTWEILGFNQAANPNLSAGNGTTYSTRSAYQTVVQTPSLPPSNPNYVATFNGELNLNSDFNDINGVNAIWIHWKGITTSAAANALNPGFLIKIDNIKIAYDKLVLSGNPAAISWQKDLEAYQAGLKTDLDASYSALQTELTKQLTIDAYSAVLNQMTPQIPKTVQIFQQQPLETRIMPTFSGKYYFDDATLAFSGGISDEPDFYSNFGSVNLSHELNDKLTTLSIGYNGSSNQISRSTDHVHGSGVEHNHGGSDSPNYPLLNETSYFNGLNLGVSQILSKNTLFQSTAGYTNQSGYLSNPYKYVYIRGEVTAEEYYQIEQASTGTPFDWNSVTQLEMVGIELFREARPDQRNLFSLSNRINHYIPELDATAHADYRFFTDDWGINSHTLELKWFQSLPNGFTVTPSFRYYTQSQADFFAPYFLAPRADGYYTSDFRMADFGAVSGGVTFSKQFSKGLTLDAGFEYYTRQSDLKLGGGQDTSYADYNYYMVHAGLNINLSAPPSQSMQHQGHHMHHHGAPLPAGVMYGHMMNTPGEFMVGYRYNYTNQTGDMWHGSHAVNDTSLLHLACGSDECSSRPTEMRMNMHMLDLMYAPTDWLNVMLMPQIMDMKMTMSDIPGSSIENEHGSLHSSGDLGDTIMAALVKVVDVSDQHAHLGLGFSAPTGNTDVTVDGQDASVSDLQDYGMQLGSGTWDFRPSLTYTGVFEDWSWGAQISGIIRMQDKNRMGYALGDAFQSTAWGNYKVLDWLSTSIRGIYSEQGAIKGQFNSPHTLNSPVDYTSNYGGHYWDVGFGFNVTIPEGPLTGHNLSVEWLQPVADNYNGYQLEREGSLNATWTFAF
jgi:Protein of unknown function (DUF3570)